jgi:hypothetical protein
MHGSNDEFGQLATREWRSTEVARVSRLLINEPPLQVLPSLAVAIGLQEAIVLQQVHYWLQASKPSQDGARWVYNTYEQWRVQFPFWSAEALRKIFKSLRDQGLIVARPRASHAFDRVNEYTIDYPAIIAFDAEKSTASSGKTRDGHAEEFTASAGPPGPHHAEEFTASGRTNLPPLCTETTQETTAENSARKRASAPKKLTIQDLVSEGVDEGHAEAWLQVRKDKRLPLTAGAWQITREDGAKCGMDAAATVRACLSRGWAAFRADWYSTQPAGAESFRERDERVAAEAVRNRAAVGEAPAREPLPFERGYVKPVDAIEGSADVRRIR